MIEKTDHSHYYAVIMAGGGGTRLWPLSRAGRPKQMLALVDDRSMFQVAAQRLAPLFPPERIMVVTAAEQAAQLREQVPELPGENFILEPQPRGTAPAIGLAAVALNARDPQATMAVLTADHFIGDEARFRHLLQAACAAADQDFLVTLGITPTYPATGYGYIHRGARVGSYEGIEAYQVLRFKEKPGEDQARQLLAGGDHDWNSGMFVWQVLRLMEESARQMPDLSSGLMAIAAAWDSSQRQEVLAQVWPGLQKEMIDYGIMEGAHKVAVIPAQGLGWNDIGSWDALFDILPGDEHGNVQVGGNATVLDTQDSLLYLKESGRHVVALGLQDVVIVDMGDVVLVCSKDHAQKVRQAVQRLEESGRNELL